MENVNKIKELVASLDSDVAKFEGGNSSAGSRIRKTMQEIKVLCQAVRVEVQETKNAKKK